MMVLENTIFILKRDSTCQTPKPNFSISVLEIVTPEKRAYATSLRYLFWMSGMLLAVGAAYLFRNWRTFMLVIATPTMLNAIVLLWVSHILRYDVMASERFPHYWPFDLKGIHRCLLDYSEKGPVTQGFDFFFVISFGIFVVSPNNLLNKQWICRWFARQ